VQQMKINVELLLRN